MIWELEILMKFTINLKSDHTWGNRTGKDLLVIHLTAKRNVIIPPKTPIDPPKINML
jgi:hypothetical protein